MAEQNTGLQALMRDGMPAGLIKYPLRIDTQPRAVFPAGQLHLEAITAGALALALERATLYPWIVTVRARIFDPSYCGGAYRLTEKIVVVQAAKSAAPDGLEFVPEGWEFMRSDVFPATHFDEMNGSTRRLYETHYRAYLAWRSERAGIEPDGESIYERAYSWVRSA